jgi:GNAT superfamily N-acetyltransferase
MSDNALDVRKIENDADMQAFLRFHWTCYQDVPNWVPPLWSEHKAFFDREENPELHHIDVDYFGAWRGDTLVGIIAAFVNHAYNDFQETNVGWFGSFEVLDDREAARALLETAEAWCREKGVPVVHGPATFSTNSEIGLLVDGFDTPPMVLTTHAHPYYQDFVESAGYQQTMDLLCYFVDGNIYGGKKADNIPEKLARVMGKLQKRRNFTIRTVNMRDFDNEVERVKKIYHSAWEKNWGFIPFADVEIEKLAQDLKTMIDPDISVFVEVDGEPIAFGLPLPNLYEPLRKARAHPDTPEIFTLLKLLWHWKVRGVKSVRVWALGVLEEYRGTGVDGLMYFEMMKRGLKKGYLDIEMSWILEDNVMMNRAIHMLRAEVYKTYRVYEKAL